MNLIKLIFGSSEVSIKDEQTGLAKFTRLTVLSADILTNATTTDNPMNATPTEALESVENSLLTNIKSVKVLMPSSLTLNCLVTDQSTSDSIMHAWSDQEATFTITSRAIISQAMALVNVEFKQTNQNTSAIIATLTFEQTAEAQLSNFDPKQAADRDTLGITTKVPTSLTSTVGNFYNNVKSKIGALL
ncbi:hypothetical protein KYLE_48 [Pantoea phage Kyle]|uniref:Uncharacterized protein n=1 Tax=Pantoea phage Kyle TaxID=2589665 RepID=A0A514A8Q1_9CAUD|nr:hypothetical protein HWC52_gp048 [Pantoea phage Kyle]QDH49604.1 hypothetical protein KYLE_48 [Pantoea phage Kyle]